MVAPYNHCPSRAELRSALQHSHADAADSDLSSHLEHCPHCRQELESLAAGPQWWDSARIYLREDTTPKSDYNTPRSAQPQSKHSRSEDSQHLAWLPAGLLAPSIEPECLGRIGAYDVVEVIGRGGMGIVLKAFDPALHRYVAIKVLASEFAHSAAARRRFAREAQAAAAVVHDHVVPIYAVDTSGPVPFLVMAYIPGHSLQERIDQTGPLEIREILRIGMQAAAGLAAAHAQGLVHRDIKPANILLENGVERVRITDFGLARAMDDATQTQSGVLAGTPQYMAPEQACGEAVDHRADLFSLGSVMYAMCAAHSPFRAETTVAVLRRICDGSPRPIRQVNPDVPDWLASIVHKLLAKSSSDRFQSADEVARVLAEQLAQLQQPIRPSVWRPRLKLAGLAAAVVAVVLLLGFGLQQWLSADRNADSGAAHLSVGTAQATAVLTAIEPDTFDRDLQQTEERLRYLEASLRAPTQSSALPDRTWNEIQQLLHTLEQNLDPPTTLPPGDGRVRDE
jgi:serine/threonine-protein kinase